MFAEAPTLHPLWNALLMGVFGAIGVSIPLWFKNRSQREVSEAALKAKEQEIKAASEAKKQDWERQDAVAAKAAEAARLLLAANERVAASSGEMNGKLDVIHDLVNSKMTESMQNELDSRINELALMKELLDLKKAPGNALSPEGLGAIKTAEARISELRARMKDRLAQQATIDEKKK